MIDRGFGQAIGEKVNNGCLHFQRLEYLSAIKQWKIAVDQMLMSMKVERSAIMRNIGIAYIQLERYQVEFASLKQRVQVVCVSHWTLQSLTSGAVLTRNALAGRHGCF